MAELWLRNIRVRCFLFASVCLFAGIAVYVFIRPADSAFFIPNSWQGQFIVPASLQAVSGSLPSFTHTLAFCLLLVAVSAHPQQQARRVILSWCLIEVIVELCQQEDWFVRLGMVPSVGVPLPRPIEVLWSYVVHSRFAIADLIAILVAGAVAYLIVKQGEI